MDIGFASSRHRFTLSDAAQSRATRVAALNDVEQGAQRMPSADLTTSQPNAASLDLDGHLARLASPTTSDQDYPVVLSPYQEKFSRMVATI